MDAGIDLPVRYQPQPRRQSNAGSHEELADLLEQLRRLQDLQVTIEVRFITLNDNFFERVGVSFDFEYSGNIEGKWPSANSWSSRRDNDCLRSARCCHRSGPGPQLQ